MMINAGDIAEILADHFASVSKEDPNLPVVNNSRLSESYGINFTSLGGESYNVSFSIYELQMALKQCHDFTSA